MRATLATLLLVLALSTCAGPQAFAFAQDATVAVTAPEINPILTVYEQARAVIVDAVLALGTIAIGFIFMQVRKLLGEQIANQFRKYGNEVMEKIVTTWLGRTPNAQLASTNEKVKDKIIDGAAKDIIVAIPDFLNKFKVPLDPTSPKLRDMVEARITEQLLEADPQKTLAAPDPHGPEANKPDLDAPYSPPKGDKK